MERVIVVGAGKVGFHLAKVLISSSYEVVLVERDPARGASVSESLSVQVFRGDGTDISTLKDAGTEGAAYFVSATGSDADNLVACQIAKNRFHARHTIARVIDPSNERLFKMLGIDAVISTTSLAAMTIRNVLPSNGLRLTSIFDRGDVELAEIELQEHWPVVGRSISEIELPKDCLLIAVLRDDTVSLPRGSTVLNVHDRVFALTRSNEAEALRKVLDGGR
jgi:trk system potassium uptake protein TrkA